MGHFLKWTPTNEFVWKDESQHQNANQNGELLLKACHKKCLTKIPKSSSQNAVSQYSSKIIQQSTDSCLHKRQFPNGQSKGNWSAHSHTMETASQTRDKSN